MEEQFVLIYLKFPTGSLDDESALNAVFELEDILVDAVETDCVGTFDGNEFCDDTVTFFIYGQDANRISEAIYPIISKIKTLPGSYILKNHGLQAKEQKIKLAN